MNKELHSKLVDACEYYCMLDKYDKAIEKLNAKVVYFENEKKKIGKAPANTAPNVIIILLFCIPLCFIVASCVFFFSKILGLLTFLLLCLISCFSAVRYKKHCEKKNKQEQEKAYKYYNEVIEPARRENSKSLYSLSREHGDFRRANLHVLNVVPEHYRNNLAVAFMERAVRTGRADTIKEAINLFEEQLHRWSIEEKAQCLVEQNQLQTDMLNERLLEISRNQSKIKSSLKNIENLEFYNTFCR